MNTLRLPQADLEAILREEDTRGLPAAGESRRRSRRWSHMGVRGVLSVVQTNGTLAHHVVATRNLSTGGIGLVHGGFLYPGTRCAVSLKTRAGESRSLEGTIVKCALMKGRLHDVGIRFDREINPLDYLDPRDEAAFNVEDVDPAALRGELLLMDADESTHELFRHHLRDTRLRVSCVVCAESALEALGTEPDICFLELDLPGGEGVTLVRGIRERNYLGPLIVVTSDGAKDLRRRVIEAGANELLRKPAPPRLLLQAVAEYLVGAPGSKSSFALIFSDADPAEVPPELVEGYVTRLRAQADALAAAEAGSEEAVRILRALRGAAGGYGFAPIAVAAQRAIERLDAAEDAEEQTQEVVSACYRARAKPSPQPAGEAGDAPETEPGQAAGPDETTTGEAEQRLAS